MSEFNCDICNCKFKSKRNLVNHQNKKFSCELDEVAKKKLLIMKRTCNICTKVFSSIQSLVKHQEGKCKAEQQKDNDKQVLIQQIDELKNTVESMKKEMEQFKQDKNKSSKNNKTVITSNGDGIVQSADTIINNTSERVINISGGNTNIVHNINNIILSPYGEEDLSYITDEIYKKFLEKGFKSVGALVEYIHFNKNKPENHNVYISNLRDKYVLYFNGEEWQIHDKKDFLETMVDKKSELLSIKFDKLHNQLDDITKKKFGRFLTDMDEDYAKNNNIKDVFELCYNKRKMPETIRGVVKPIYTKKDPVNKRLYMKKNIMLNNEPNIDVI